MIQQIVETQAAGTNSLAFYQKVATKESLLRMCSIAHPMLCGDFMDIMVD